MTKVQAIEKVMKANGGTATLQKIYAQAKLYKRDVQQAADWKAGLRGVLYREVRAGKTFKKIQDAEYGLIGGDADFRKAA